MSGSLIKQNDFLLPNTNEWAQLCTLLIEKLSRYVKDNTPRKKEISSTQLLCLIRNGTYSENILKKLRKKGVSQNVIIRCMKFGLINVDIKELKNFENFNISPEILQSEEIWSDVLDNELILHLKSVGLSDAECWRIIMYGLASQDGCILLKLAVSGIDVPGILNWQGPTWPVTKEILQFINNIGLEKHIVDFVNEYGIDDESLIILKKLGYTENLEDQHEILCECSSSTSKSEIPSTSESEEIQSPPCTCCQDYLPKMKDPTELTAQRNDYLRQNVMVPLAWAIAKTLQYMPSDPLHYIAHQLLRWKYNNVPESEKIAAHNTVASATIKMDINLVKQKRKEDRKAMRKTTEKEKSVPCNECLKCSQLGIPRTMTRESSINFSEILRSASSSISSLFV